MRPLGSENRVGVEGDPYKLLALSVIERAVDDEDKWWLRKVTSNQRFWLDCAGIDHYTFQTTMRNRYTDMRVGTKKPQKPRKAYPRKNVDRNLEIIEHCKANKSSHETIAEIFGMSWETIRKIVARGY